MPRVAEYMQSRYFKFLRNNAHLNITSMFAEQKYRAREEDTLSVGGSD